MPASLSSPRNFQERQNRAEPVFRLEKLEFAYAAGRKVLDGISFSLYPGQSIGLWGNNGSGKSTLFRCITGLEKINAGKIFLGGKVIRNEKDFYELRRNVGYILQDSDDQLFFPAVLEDLAFGPLNLGLSAEEANKRGKESLKEVGLEGFEERLNQRLSGGEKKLVAIAAMLAMRPRALLIDEPLNELDEEASGRIENLLQRLACAKIIVSHDSAFLRRLCPTILHLKNGILMPFEQEASGVS